jgi:hypothetical protein
MNLIFRLVAVLSVVFNLAVVVLMLVTFRKERRIGVLSLLLSLVLSGMILFAFILLSGARLRWIFAVPGLFLGLVVGLVGGALTRLYRREGDIVGRYSLLLLVGWGGSLLLSQVLNLFGSATLSAVGLIPLYLSTGTQVGMNLSLFARRLWMAAHRPVGG